MPESPPQTASLLRIEHGENQPGESSEVIKKDSSLQDHQANEETTTFLTTPDQDPQQSAPPTVWPQVSL